MADVFDRFDGARSVYAMKKPCRAATTINIALHGFQVIDGITYALSDEAAGYNMRCLVKNQNDTTANGVYVVNSGDWTRDKDFDGNTDFTRGTSIFVSQGSANGGKIFMVSSADPQSIGVSAISFSQFRHDSVLAPTDEIAVGTTLDLTSYAMNIETYGTATIGTLTVPDGDVKVVTFDDAVTLTHGSTTIVLPGSQNIAVAAGDSAIFVGGAAGETRCVAYGRANSQPLIAGYASIASAATTNIGAVREQCILITGVVTITSLGASAAAGTVKHITFESSLTLTHHGTALILPAAANITTLAGDTMTVHCTTAGNWKVISYARAMPGGIVSSSVASVSTTGTTAETNLKTYSVPAGLMAIAGYAVRVEAWGTVAATTTNKRVTAYFGGTTLADSGTLALNGTTWMLSADIFRVSSTAQEAITTLFSSTSNPAIRLATAPGEDLSGAVTLRVAGTASSTVTAQIVARGMTVELIPI